MVNSCIPVLDMQGISGQLDKVVKALWRWGCFRLFDHGIPSTLMSDMKAVSLSLFDLPLEIKKRNVYPQRLMGYIPRNTINSFYEALGAYDMLPPEAVDRFCDKLDASPHQR